MRYLLDLPSIKVRYRLAQVKEYLRVAERTGHPLHASVGDDKGYRLKRGKSWMAAAEDTLSLVCDVDDIVRGEEWVQLEDHEDRNTVIITLGRECREWQAGVADTEVRQLIDDNSKPRDPILYTDGSVTRGRQSGWGYVAFQNGRQVARSSGAYRSTTSSMRMEIEAVTAAFTWLCAQDATHAVVVTDSQSMLRKIEAGKMRREWVELLGESTITHITWIFCPGHSGVMGNEVADRLAGQANAEGECKMDHSELLKAVNDILRQEENDEADHHLRRMMDIGVKRGCARSSQLVGKLRRTTNQRLTGTISSHTLQWLLGWDAEHAWECPECQWESNPVGVQ
ncbi:MAG: RNAse HI domain-containing protein [Candidatus Omnitrophica bacterium]|nr:RNAse HI domain-containing protein [Candidatus Omnitrophota bacterium]